MRRGWGVILAVLLAAVAARGAASGTGVVQPGVLVIGDSISTGMYWYASATVERHLDVHWQIAICRRLAGESCVDEGEQPPTLLDVVSSLGTVPPTVVVEMGYNDYPETFAANVESSIAALTEAGAQRILWLTLREAHDPFPQMNEILRAAARTHPEVQLLDWNAYAAPHTDWFQNDFVHVTRDGGIAMAHFVHAALDARLNPLRIVTRTLPALRRGRPFTTVLHASGGNAAYVWSVASGRLPRGLHLLRTGKLFGKPATLEPFTVRVRVTDEDGLSAVSAVREVPDSN